jgi:alkyl hydroperoxide reductase subunit AhpC
MARPSEYNFDLCIEICNKIADGQNIKAILESKDNYPAFSTWCKWKRENQELSNLYVNSIQDKSESVDAQIDEIWEGCKNGLYDASTANVLIQTLKWKASKYYPKMFGDKVQQEHSGEITTNVISLGSGIKPNETIN